MKLEKAIQLLQQDINSPGSVDRRDIVEAEQLGIEALERVKGNRMYPQATVYPFLPGETEE